LALFTVPPYGLTPYTNNDNGIKEETDQEDRDENGDEKDSTSSRVILGVDLGAGTGLVCKPLKTALVKRMKANKNNDKIKKKRKPTTETAGK
jgi:tRNA U34 5-methylaminomethyl-2-thiouridine-forming methyltransferase MnmC